MSQDLAWRNLLKEQSWMQEAMDAANTGLWVIMIDTRNGGCSMLASAPMLRLLGLEEHPAPEECFAFWRGRVDKKCDDDVNDVVDQFLADTQLHEVRYPYHHPKWGVIFVRCGGRRISADDDPLVRITGYHQDVSEIQAMHQSLRESLARLSLACRLGQLGVFELRHGEGELELTGNDIFLASWACLKALAMKSAWTRWKRALCPRTARPGGLCGILRIGWWGGTNIPRCACCIPGWASAGSNWPMRSWAPGRIAASRAIPTTSRNAACTSACCARPRTRQRRPMPPKAFSWPI